MVLNFIGVASFTLVLNLRKTNLVEQRHETKVKNFNLKDKARTKVHRTENRTLPPK